MEEGNNVVHLDTPFAGTTTPSLRNMFTLSFGSPHNPTSIFYWNVNTVVWETAFWYWDSLLVLTILYGLLSSLFYPTYWGRSHTLKLSQSYTHQLPFEHFDFFAS